MSAIIKKTKATKTSKSNVAPETPVKVIYKDDVASLIAMHASGVDVIQQQVNPALNNISNAARIGSLGCLKFLIDLNEAKPFIDVMGTKLISTLVTGKRKRTNESNKMASEIIDDLIAMGVSLEFQSPSYDTLIMSAIKAKDTFMVDCLIGKGADVNELSNGGWKALNVAQKFGNPEALTSLLAAGALEGSPLSGSVVKNGWSPTFSAISNSNVDMLEALLKAGADPNEVGVDGLTPLSFICSYTSFAPRYRNCDEEELNEMIDILLENGADINKQTEQGWTPLMFASKNNNIICVAKLLACKADVSLCSVRGKKASDYDGFLNTIEAWDSALKAKDRMGELEKEFNLSDFVIPESGFYKPTVKCSVSRYNIYTKEITVIGSTTENGNIFIQMVYPDSNKIESITALEWMYREEVCNFQRIDTTTRKSRKP